MKIQRTFIVILLPLLLLAGCGRQRRNDDGILRTEEAHTFAGYPVVYVTPDVSPQGLLSAYELLEVSDDQNVAIRLSDTETDTGFVWADLVDDLSQAFEKSTIIETAVESDLSEYDSIIMLSHFRSHDIVGFNGAVKQTASIFSSSCESDHSLTAQEKMDMLLETGKQAADNLSGQILYINVMDRLSIESSGITLPESNTYDIGILSSYDPVALDQACIDFVNMLKEVWARNGKKRVVWRCVSRLEFGKKYCHNSPTLDEEKLHRAILDAINEFAQVEQEVKADILELTGLAWNGQEAAGASLLTLRQRLKDISSQQALLLDKVLGDMDNPELNAQLKTLVDEKQAVQEQINTLELNEVHNANHASRMAELKKWMAQLQANSQYDDEQARMAIEKIAVLDADTIRIKFKYPGLEVEKKLIG